MRATVMYRAGDVRIENVPDATIVKIEQENTRLRRGRSLRLLEFDPVQFTAQYCCQPRLGAES